MKKSRIVLTAVALVFAMVALFAISSTTQAAPPGPQPGCNERCKPFVHGPNGMKCYFVGCDVEGICRYIC